MTDKTEPSSSFQRDDTARRHLPDPAELAKLAPKRPKRGEEPKKPQPKSRRRLAVAAAGLLLALAVLRSCAGGDAAENVTLDAALAMIADGDIERATIDDDSRTVELVTVDGETLSSSYPMLYGTELVERLEAAGVEFDVEPTSTQPLWHDLLWSMLPLLLIGGMMLYTLSKYAGSGKFAAGDSKRAKAVEPPDTTLADVAGAPEAVEDLKEIVEFLRDPQRFSRLGATPPRGVLLVGPPGTGKTLLARAVAGEAGVPFFAMSGSDFVELFVGVGAARVRSSFEKARKSGRAVVFIDEIDAVGKSRGGLATGANDERENTLNALLVELDGFHDHNIVVIGATNRPETLDEALLRPGRFDRQVHVPAPDRRGRRELFAMYLRRITLDASCDIDELADRFARRSPGMTGADIKSICNEAALAAAKAGAAAVGVVHLEQALERSALGRERRSAEVSERARKVTAWHEAGHAVCALVQPDATNPERVSIVPRGAAGGVTWFSAPDDEHFVTRAQCTASLVVAFGGRAGEELILDGDFTQGAASDIAQATERATKMVCEWGMSTLGMGRIDTDRLMGEPAEQVRLEVASMLDTAMRDARAIVAQHRALLDAIAGELLENETLDRDDLDRLVAEHLDT